MLQLKNAYAVMEMEGPQCPGQDLAQSHEPVG